MRRYSLPALLLCALTLTGCSLLRRIFGREIVEPPTQTQGEWGKNWMLFPFAESDVHLGDAFDGSGSPDSGCYKIGSRVNESGSLSKYRIEWDKKTKGRVNLQVVHILGFDASFDHSDHGSIEFDSVYIQRATNIRPDFGCSAQALDRLPIRPAIVALIGAKNFTFDISDSAGNSLNQQATFEIAGHAVADTVTFSDTTDSRTVARFDKPRWVGANYVGFQQTTHQDSAQSLPTDLGKWTALNKFKWSVFADVASGKGTKDPEYRLIMKSGLGGTNPDTVLVHENEPFAFGQSQDVAMGGAYYLGTFFIGGKGESQYTVLVEQRQFAQVSFNNENARNSMASWTSKRAGATSVTP